MTPEEILAKQKPHMEYNSYYHECKIIEAMDEYAAQQSQLSWEAGCRQVLDDLKNNYSQFSHIQAIASDFPIPPYPGTDKLLDAEKREAIAFHEWAAKNSYISTSLPHEPVQYWQRYYLNDKMKLVEGPEITTDQLYVEFKNPPQ